MTDPQAGTGRSRRPAPTTVGGHKEDPVVDDPRPGGGRPECWQGALKPDGGLHVQVRSVRRRGPAMNPIPVSTASIGDPSTG